MFVELSHAMRRVVFMNVQTLVDQKIIKIGRDANFLHRFIYRFVLTNSSVEFKEMILESEISNINKFSIESHLSRSRDSKVTLKPKDSLKFYLNLEHI
jgi:hypothetical protein